MITNITFIHNFEDKDTVKTMSQKLNVTDKTSKSHIDFLIENKILYKKRIKSVNYYFFTIEGEKLKYAIDKLYGEYPILKVIE